MSLSSARRGLSVLAVACAFLPFFSAPAAADPNPNPDVQAALARWQTDDPTQVGQKGKAFGLIARTADGGDQHTYTVGRAERNSATPRDVDDHFRAGSTTKMMMSALVLKLGLDLDAPIPVWLQNKIGSGCNWHYSQAVLCWNGTDSPSHMTIRSLLNHTSGLGSYDAHATFLAKIGPDLMSDQDGSTSNFSLDKLLEYGVTHGPLFSPNRNKPLCVDPAPGAAGKKCLPWEKTGFLYSNTNYVALAMIIENVTGKTYSRNITEQIIQPLGLTETSMPGSVTVGSSQPLTNQLPTPHSQHYTGLRLAEDPNPHPLGIYNSTVIDPTLASAAGDQISTTGDLIKLVKGIVSGPLLTPAQRQEMLTLTTVKPGGVEIPWAEDIDGLRWPDANGQLYLAPELEGVSMNYGLGVSKRTITCAGSGQQVVLWGHNGYNPGSLSYAYTTGDGEKAIAFNLNSDWVGKLKPFGSEAYYQAELVMLHDVLRAHFC